jgi:hypothetical protein
MEKALELIGLIAFAIAAMFYRYFVITKVWALVVVPNFAVQPIGMWKSFALCTFASFLTLGYKSDAEDKKTSAQRFAGILAHVLSLSLGWGICALIF